MNEKEIQFDPNIKRLNLYHPNTKIVNPPTLLTHVSSLTQVQSYIDNKRPHTLIIHIDETLNVLDNHKRIIDSLESLATLKHQFIVAIETEDVEIANAFVNEMQRLSIHEFFVISKSEQLLKTCKNINKHTNPILKIIDINQVDFNQIPFHKIILPIDILTKEMVSKLQRKTYFVLTETATPIEREKALLSGINGIITCELTALIARLEAVDETTHVRDINFIAHRGLHQGYKQSVSPENTLSTAKHVYQSGAKIIEIDIHLTKDNQVVVFHDFKTNRLARRRRIIADTTLEKLIKIPLKKTAIEKKHSHMSSLKDFLTPFIDKDVLFFIETKPLSQALIVETAHVLKDLNMMDKVIFISFFYQNTLWQQTYMPTVKNGFLYGKNIPTHDDALAKLLWFMIPLSATYNPNQSFVTDTLVRELNCRGITVWPWTADGVSDIFKVYNTGVAGITTNTFDNIKDALIYLTVEQVYNFTRGQSPLSILVLNHTLSGVKKTITGELILIDDGKTGITFNGHQIIDAKHPGTATFYVKVKLNLLDGSIIYKTTEVFKVNVQ